MALKITLRNILPCCFKPQSFSLEPNKQISNKNNSSGRLPLLDISDPDSMLELSNSFIGSNLHIFTLKELRLITHDFSSTNYLGEGGFGPVHKGFIDDKIRPGLEAQPVAVKLLDLDGDQGHREWQAEVIFLGQLKHPHLVKLIGYCWEDENRLLVYEYMARGSLENQLFRRYSISLPWLTRVKVALGAAKGLAFLHEEEKPVIFRDLKASNILLDAEYTAKLSDFGLAKDGPKGDETHVTTRIMGTEGYAAPEYIMTGHLTTMSDVYSFGVVLLELLTGRRAIDKSRRDQNLVEWARPLLKDPQKLDRIMDPRLEGQYSMKGARKAAELAYQCVSHSPKCRPKMSDVVKTLETLLDSDDIPVGSFVYVVPTECDKKGNDIAKIGKEEKEAEEKKEKGHKQKRRLRSLRSRAVHSDTALYTTLRNGVSSSKHLNQQA